MSDKQSTSSKHSVSEQQTPESMLKAWSETQQKLLSDWLDTLRKMGGTATLELWTKTIDAWQASVKETVDARAEFSRRWAETLAKAKGTPEEIRELAHKEREEMQQWAEAERELWKDWFNVVRHINFRPEQGVGAKAGKDLVELWQESAHKMIDAQAALVRRFTGGSTGTKKQGQ